MKKKYLALIPAVLIGAYLAQDIKVTTVKNPEPQIYLPKEIKIKPHDQVAVDATREPAKDPVASAPHVKTLSMKKSRTKTLQESVRADIKLPHGLVLAEHVFAVPKNDYAESMGETISENGGFIFFKADTKPTGVPNVAVDGPNNKFYPINAVVKLENISEETRQGLKSQGLEENYYHPELKIMFVQSTHDEVLSLYSELTQANLEASLEVNRGYHRPR